DAGGLGVLHRLSMRHRGRQDKNSSDEFFVIRSRKVDRYRTRHPAVLVRSSDGCRAGAAMAAARRAGPRRYLAGLGLPDRDLGELPTSPKRFADGAQFRVEIPSVEGPGPFRAVVEAAGERDLRVHRISQGSGMLLLTDHEIRT